MDTPKLVDALLTGGLRLVALYVMYLAIFTYRLPYLQVVLAYAALTVLLRIYDDVIRHRIIGGDNRPMPGYGMALGIMDMLILFGSFVGVGIMSSYRFSVLESVGVLVGSVVTGSVTDAVVRRM
jgi:hypothetical protein